MAGQGKEASKYKYSEPPASQQQAANNSPLGDISTGTDTRVDATVKSGFEAGEAVVVAGRTGEKNLSIQWINVPLAGALSASFVVKTTPGNNLEVLIEQRSYKKTYTGSGTISTQVLPAAPQGTIGKLIARDLTTGESREQPWRWVNVGSSGDLSGLWETIKKFFWKPRA